MKDALFLKGQVIFPESILNLYSVIHPVRSKENNYIFLGGGDALRYLAGLMYKKYSTTFIWDHPFSTYVSYYQFFNPLPLVRVCTHLE